MPLMSSRFEVKYLLSPKELQKFANLADRWLCPDVFPEYMVQSIYFDSPDFRFYEENQEGVDLRIKPRIRIYREKETLRLLKVFIELKYRFNRTIKKERTLIDLEHAVNLLNLKFEPICKGDSALSKFEYLAKKFQLSPKANILYTRKAYWSDLFPGLRVTLDSALQGGLPGNSLDIPQGKNVFFLDPAWKILEIKYNKKLPNKMLEMISGLDVSQQTISKYALLIYHIYGKIANHFQAQCNFSPIR